MIIGDIAAAVALGVMVAAIIVTGSIGRTDYRGRIRGWMRKRNK